jgi:hypothetical protein
VNFEDIFLYVRHFNTNITRHGTEFFYKSVGKDPSGGGINFEELNSFFITITGVFEQMLSGGLLSIEDKPVPLNGTYLTDFFYCGLHYIKNGYVPETMSFLLEYLSVLIAAHDKELSATELLEMRLVGKILPLFWPTKESIFEYAALTSMFTSKEVGNPLCTKLDKLAESF